MQVDSSLRAITFYPSNNAQRPESLVVGTIPIATLPVEVTLRGITKNILEMHLGQNVNLRA